MVSFMVVDVVEDDSCRLTAHFRLHVAIVVVLAGFRTDGRACTALVYGSHSLHTIMWGRLHAAPRAFCLLNILIELVGLRARRLLIGQSKHRAFKRTILFWLSAIVLSRLRGLILIGRDELGEHLDRVV